MRTPFKLKSGKKTSFKDMGSTDAVAKDMAPWDEAPQTLRADLRWGIAKGAHELPEIKIAAEKTAIDVSEAIPATRRLASLMNNTLDMSAMQDKKEKEEGKKKKSQVRKLMDEYNTLQKTIAGSSPSSKPYKAATLRSKQVRASIKELAKH